MASIPSVLVVLDLDALAVLGSLEWLELSRVGKVYLPQTVYEELRLAFDRSPDPDLENISRAFTRFYPTSGWETTEATAHHAELKPPSGQALPKRTRLAFAAARCAFALSQTYSTSMVVLVTGDRTLLKKLQEIDVLNLCAITPPEVLQWSRTGNRTASVLHKFHQLRGMQGATVARTPGATSRTATAPRRSAVSTAAGSTATTTRVVPRSPTRAVGLSGNFLQQAFALVLALGGLLVAGWLVWLLIHNIRVGDVKILPDTNKQQQQK